MTAARSDERRRGQMTAARPGECGVNREHVVSRVSAAAAGGTGR